MEFKDIPPKTRQSTHELDAEIQELRENPNRSALLRTMGSPSSASSCATLLRKRHPDVTFVTRGVEIYGICKKVSMRQISGPRLPTRRMI